MCEILKMDPKAAARAIALHEATIAFDSACNRLRVAKDAFMADPVEENLRSMTFAHREADSLTALLLQLQTTPNVKVTGSPALSASPRGLPG